MHAIVSDRASHVDCGEVDLIFLLTPGHTKGVPKEQRKSSVKKDSRGHRYCTFTWLCLSSSDNNILHNYLRGKLQEHLPAVSLIQEQLDTANCSINEQARHCFSAKIFSKLR